MLTREVLAVRSLPTGGRWHMYLQCDVADASSPARVPDIGALAVVNDGSGTMGGSTPLALIAQVGDGE